MTVHKLTAGDGYTYLTRQVASADEQRAPGQSLADYSTARGNPPGVWLGGGAVTLGVEGGVVTEAQMKALFGDGCHPDRGALVAAGTPESETRLGARYSTMTPLPPLAERVQAAVEAFEVEHGRAPSPEEQGRLEVAETRRVRRPVAGYDLVFTPVKSASVLWALADPETRQAVEDAHHEAVRNTLGWIEREAAFTRVGHAGIAQIDTTGLVAAAFDHRESRAGDPDLHTHIAVANKVCGVDGKWRSLDARVLHALGVAASERYNTRFEDAMARRLGVEFEERGDTDPGKRPVREIVGVPRELIAHFSKRRAAIEDRYGELLSEYRAAHGRGPNRSTQLQLAQQATLETREGKGPGRTLAEQLADWREQAVQVLGRPRAEGFVRDILGRRPFLAVLDEETLDRLARQVVVTVSEQRSTWTRWNARAEAERVLRHFRFGGAESREAVTDRVVQRAVSEHLAIRIQEPELVREPDGLRRGSDQQSVFLVHGGERYTTSRVLQAEESLVAAAVTHARAVDPLVAEAALAVHEAEGGVALDAGQRQLVEYFATYPVRLSVGIGPAGAGKTTAMQAYAAVLAADGRRLVPLASSAKAAQVLGSELDLRAENLHKFLHESRRLAPDPWFELATGDVVLVDEASMAGTLHLAALVALAGEAGASVRLVGDPAQLASVDAGGALRLLEAEVGAARLDHLHRFVDPAEATATLGLREGNPDALGFYLSHDRVREGARDAMLEAAYDGWAADIARGRTSVLVAVHGSDVLALNVRARTERVELGQVSPDGVTLRDDTTAGVGDWVVTRTNLRGLTCHHGKDWVKNGDTWEVTHHHSDGSLTVRHQGHAGVLRLPAAYVTDHVELAYATTAHRAQGSTVDTTHALVTEGMTRESLYVASTRGRASTTWYTATEGTLGFGSDHEPDPPVPAVEVLTGILQRTAGDLAATTTVRETQREATSLPTLVARYRHVWDEAARTVLQTTVPLALSSDLATRVLSEPGFQRLATALAGANAHGADPVTVLRNAAALDDLEGVRSVPLVLATRIEETPTALGVPRKAPARQPLPWLPGPRVGHPQWDDYLTARAALITNRATELGSLTAAYREQYRLTHLPVGDLGDLPPEASPQRLAYLAARREQHTHLVRPPAEPRRLQEPYRRPDPPHVGRGLSM